MIWLVIAGIVIGGAMLFVEAWKGAEFFSLIAPFLFWAILVGILIYWVFFIWYPKIKNKENN